MARFEDIETVRDTQRETLEAAGFTPVLRWERDGLEVCTRTALEAAGVTAKVDLPALRHALATIKAHADLLATAFDDLGRQVIRGAVLIDWTQMAIDHVIEDEFRSHETRGGS